MVVAWSPTASKLSLLSTWPYKYFYFNHMIQPNKKKSKEEILSDLINKDAKKIFAPNNNDFFDAWGG